MASEFLGRRKEKSLEERHKVQIYLYQNSCLSYNTDKLPGEDNGTIYILPSSPPPPPLCIVNDRDYV